MQSLTESQIQAINKVNGPCIILAGAGTGKTSTIVEKIKYLIQNNVYQAEKIVCITFSNEACNSLQTKITKTLPAESKNPIIRTFHAFSADLLRQHGSAIQLNSDFKILTPDEAKIALYRNFKVPPANCHRYISSISTAKDLGITIENLKLYLEKKLAKYQNIDLEKRLESLQFEFQIHYLKKDNNKHFLSAEIKKIKDILNLKKFISSWQAYEKLKKIKNYQDYSDLNKNALELLKKQPQIAENFEYIIVDEFQDTNKIQLEILFHLAINTNITVVGDTNQSIYRFRGAYNKNLEEFRQHFKITKNETFNLDKSHRSTNKILKTAHQLISNNYQNKEDCFEVKNAYNIDGENIRIFELKDQKEEARKIIEIIKEKISKKINLNEICIMFRNHQYGRIIKRALEFADIPYCSVSKSSLLEQKSIKTVINFLTILDKLKSKANGGEQAWWELLYQLNLKEKDMIKAGKFIKQKSEEENLSVKLLNELTNLQLENQNNLAIKVFIERIKLMLQSLQKPLPELLKDVFYFSGIINEQTKKEKKIHLNLNKFYDLAKTHSSLYEPDLESFLQYLEIIKSLKIEISSPEIEENGVRLMTLHSTKGLEYSVVILTNLAQKRFPMEKVQNNSLIPLELLPDFSRREEAEQIPEEGTEYLAHEYERQQQLFEERRLCYVAFTRAKNDLILTYANEYNNKKSFPSQFLNEISYKKNQNISFFIDNEQKFIEPEIKPVSKFNLTENFEATPAIKEIIFSPSALITFSECQKKYEYKYIYNMPEEKSQNWESLRLGSFVHHVLDNGVKAQFSSLKEFLDLAKETHLKDDWESVDLEEAEHLIKVFFERNKSKYNQNSRTEQRLNAEFEGIKFIGFADRIDISPDGIEIIDYKTGNSTIAPKNRNWQLGFYALAASKFGKVKKITLDMLKHEKPLEFEIDEKGNASASYSARMEFNINEVKEELIREAKKILSAIEDGFKPCLIEKNCEFCGEYFYNSQ